VLLAAAGTALRIAYVVFTWGDIAHPDLSSFTHPAGLMTHLFDTSPREPVFVWWLWPLLKSGLSSTPALRLVTLFWFLPTFFLFHAVARRYLGKTAVLVVLAAYAFLPAQIHSDSLGLRQTLEGTGLLLLFLTIARTDTFSRKALFITAGAATLLILTRINYLASVGLLLAAAAFRLKTPRPLLAVLPAIFLLLFHFQNNKSKWGDPLFSVNLHSYWFSNLEYIGQPGFPATQDEWQKAPYKPGLTFREWAFQRHRFSEFVKETAMGLPRCLWVFYERIYFSYKLPLAVKWGFLVLYVAGFLLALFKKGWRFLPFGLVCLILPYSFISHVFWAGRFFVPFSPLVLLLAVHTGEEIVFLTKNKRSPIELFRRPLSKPAADDGLTRSKTG